jgi:Flp pilus assembly pilin Flp
MLSSAKLGHTVQPMPIIPDVVRKFSDFLKDESAAAAIEYITLSAGIAVAVFTAVKPANLLPACHACGCRMRFVKAISKFRRHPELRIYECGQCMETVVEESRPPEKAGRQMPNSRKGARTLTAGLMFLRQKWGMSNLDIALIFGIWVGSIIFGWKQQPYWLIVPLAVCVVYTVSLIGSHSTWAATGPGLAGRRICEMWMTGKAAGLALFTLLKTWWWVRVEERY